MLPAYGGAGMYGMHVHDAVVAANETQSGITIHFVDEVYDHGKIIFQATCLLEEETGTSLAKRCWLWSMRIIVMLLVISYRTFYNTIFSVFIFYYWKLLTILQLFLFVCLFTYLSFLLYCIA